MAEEYSSPIPQYSPPASNPSPREMAAEESRQELRQAIQGSNQVLVSARTTFAMFPDTMTIDRAKVTITKRQFFSSAEVMSVRIEDVLNATCTLGPLFGTVTIVSRVMNDNQTTTVGRFWRADAKRLKRVMQGYVIALQRNIDCSTLAVPELARMLERLGADEHPST
ncbi:MAG TPA: hypothetical protein VGM08_04380 [Candidatus Saccharimonadales bacterium]|jgi:hypothetical protein